MGDDKNSRTIALLGAFIFCRMNQRLASKITGNTAELLSYLITNEGRYLQRDSIVAEFWGEQNWARGKSALNTALWRIKKISFFNEFFTLDSRGTSINLKKNPAISVDIHLLEDVIKETSFQNGPGHDLLSSNLRGQLRRAINNYFGPFLEHYDSNWVLVERERYLNFYIRALLTLMHDAAERRNYDEALEFGLKILIQDPFRESTQREVMWLYVLNGQRAAAINKYRQFRELILREMEIEPLSETHQLYCFIVSNSSCGGPEFSLSRKNPSISPTNRFSKFLIATDHSRHNLYSVLRVPVDDL